MANSSLQAIRNKVRLLTRSLTTAQLTDMALDEYINTFIAYDFPEHLRTFKLRTQFTFYTNPGQDTYPTDTNSFAGAITNPLYDFQNIYLTVHDPVYIAGFPAFFSQSREQFYGIYPLINSIASIGIAGDGITRTFTGVVNSQQAIIPPNNFNQIIGLLQNQVLFSSADISGQGLSLVDVPLVDPTTGNNSQFGNLYVPGLQPVLPPQYPIDLDPQNNINYLTGVFTITFPTAPAPGIPINSQTVPQNLALPQSLLYFNNTFIIRPVPDQPYRVNFEVYMRPTQLLVTNQVPDLQEWWQFIAYGASMKVLQDRMDLETVQLIQPEYRNQMNLVNRRTIVQNTNERTATIYTEQVNWGSGAGSWWWGGGPS